MTTAKRQKYLDKQRKKLENMRTKEEREVEINKMRDEIKKLGLPTETPGLVKFNKLVEEYVNYGSHAQGVIPLHGFGREIVYILTNNKKL